MKPLTSGPVGVSQDGDYLGRYWNNAQRRTTDAVTCEICGRKFPEISENEDGWVISYFMGRTVVEECCGAVLDMVYEESGHVFCQRFLEEFARNPTDHRFAELVMTLREVILKVSDKLGEIKQAVASCVEKVSDNRFSDFHCS